MSLRQAISLTALLTAISGATAQTPQRVGVLVDSGPRHNPQPTSAVVFRTTVANTGASATQLVLGGTLLPAGSHLVLTGLQDGAVQRLDAATLAEAQAHSAWFDGDQIHIEMVAAGYSRANRLRVEACRTARVPLQITSICGVDDRVPLSDPRIGRLPSGATAFMVGPDLALAAGHSVALAPGQLLEFRVPASTATGTPVRSHPDDQYSFRVLQLADNGIGDDWALLRLAPNANTGLIPFQRNGRQFFTLRGPVAGHAARVSGYGSSTILQRSFTQQTAVGPLGQLFATAIGHRVDTTTGSSGSPITDTTTGYCIGIHSHGGCSTGGDNWGTRTDRPDLLGAVQVALRGRIAVFGQACSSQAGLPRLSVQGVPQLGGAVTVSIDQLPIGQLGSVGLGLSSRFLGSLALPADLRPFGMPGCTLYTSLDATAALGTGLGSTGLAIPIPNLPSAAGVRVYTQYFFVDLAANAAGVVMTGAAEIIVGN